MAIDTAEKRKNISALMPPFAPGVTPNASKDAQWRRESGWGYMGFISDDAANSNYIPTWKPRRR